MAEQQQHHLAGKNWRGGGGRRIFHGRRSSAKDGEFDVWDSISLHATSFYHSSSCPNLLQRSSGSAPKPKPPLFRNSSAPMPIPDWQKIYGHDFSLHAHAGHNNYCGEEEEAGEMIPPHEYIARKLASRQISSFSVCEGAGRTLKGRDLRRVRNAILAKTGFLE
uniref:Senescence regulator n=1 Tax=Kalanchoe fedtschenkoi TaxID=63787 RepID=A0A7N0UE98_KALFE